MFTILNRSEKQTVDSVEEEFKNSRYIMRVEKPLDDVGYLLAVSTSMESDTEFGEFLRSLGNDLILLGGGYGFDIGGLFYSSEEQ